MEVLMALAARAGQVVSREELLAAVWPGVVVGDEALTQSIIKLRRALGDNPRAPSYIETISKRGYRLIAPVGQGGDAPAVTPARRPCPRARWLPARCSPWGGGRLRNPSGRATGRDQEHGRSHARAPGGVSSRLTVLPFESMGVTGDSRRTWRAESATT